MKAMGLFISFIAIMIIAFFAIGFSATITPPSNTTAAGQQYENLSKAVSLADTGLQGFYLLIIAAMVLTAAMFMYGSMRKR